ncbi:hypothetical protein DFO66_101469 [Brevibacterium sanguinis]|nr:hypothetical protein DFO66_101469 [Brevibacterium sanguinis]
MGLAFVLGSVGLTLDGLRRARRETSRLCYLGLPAVNADTEVELRAAESRIDAGSELQAAEPRIAS